MPSILMRTKHVFHIQLSFDVLIRILSTILTLIDHGNILTTVLHKNKSHISKKMHEEFGMMNFRVNCMNRDFTPMPLMNCTYLKRNLYQAIF